MNTRRAKNRTKSIRCIANMMPNVMAISIKENHKCSRNENVLIQKATNGAKRKICNENSITAKTRSLDGRREAIRTEAIIDAFMEILLAKVGLFLAPGGCMV